MTRPSQVTITQYYLSTWWCVAVTCLCLATISQACSLPVVLITGAGVLAWLWPNPRYPRLLRPWVLLLWAAFSLMIGIFRYRESHDIILPLCHGMVGLLPLAVSRKDKAKGYWRAFLLTFLISLTGLISGDEFGEFAVFILFSLAAFFNLNASHLYLHFGPAESGRTAVPRHYFAPFLSSVALGTSLGIVLFLAFPRTIQWQNPFSIRQKETVTGYTGSASLEGNSLHESKELAMIVEPGPTAADLAWLTQDAALYLRGNTVDLFDGVHWTRTNSRLTHYTDARALRFTGSFDPRLRTMKIYRELHTTLGVFYPGELREIDFPRGVIGDLAVDQSGNLMRTRNDPVRYAYQVVISPTVPPESLADLTVRQLREGLRDPSERDWKLSAAEQQRYLQVPAYVRDRPFFKKWENELKLDPNSSTLLTVVNKLARNFRTRFKASYDRKPLTPGVNAFEDFLARSRTGYCEYFATAAALYLRRMGIPARLVLGYRGGIFNQFSKVMEVRESNAHAWLEFFVPKSGWVAYDPTPQTPHFFLPGFVDYLALGVTAMRFWFESYVVQYNGQTQQQLIRDLARLRVPRPGALHFPLASTRTWVFLALGLGLLLRFAWRYRRKRRGKLELGQLPDYYLVLQRKLQQFGLQRRTGESYAGFHRRVIEQGWPESVIRLVDQALEHDLYGPTITSRTEVQSLRRQIDHTKATANRK